MDENMIDVKQEETTSVSNQVEQTDDATSTVSAEAEKKKKIKKYGIIAAIVVGVIILILLVCGGNVDRYELVEINFSTLSVNHYEYNYIEFNHNKGTYKLENKTKSNGIICKQTGKFIIDNEGNVTFTNDDVPSQDYVLYPNESVYIKGNKLYVEAYISGYGNVSMVFEK